MAAWRKRAYATFGFKPGSFSSSHGKVELIRELFFLTRRALAEGDDDFLERVFEYVLWADAQKNAEGLASAVDLAYFLPAFQDPEICALLWARLPEDFYFQKWQLLMTEPA
jgi:hypothetical protein